MRKLDIDNRKYYNPEIRILLCRKEIVNCWRHQNLAAPFWRIYSNFTDGASISFGEKMYALEPGKMFLIAPDTEYSSDHVKPFEHFYIHFQAREPYDFCPGKIYSFDISAEERNLLNTIVGYVQNPPPSTRTISMPLLALCQSLLARVPDSDLAESWHDQRIIDAVSFIDKNMQQRISNETLAEIARMSPNAFARLFKSQVGMSPQTFLAHKRVTKACMLLRFSKHTIEEVAAMTGFCDRYYFTRVFTNLRNISPVAFRKMNH
jgi:AraC-like DNA-binding protein